MSHNIPQAPARPLLWLMDPLPAQQGPAQQDEEKTVVRGPWPEELTREASNPLLARWSLDGNLGNDSEAVLASVALLDDDALVDPNVNDDPLVIETEQATLVLEKTQLAIDAEWDRLNAESPWHRRVPISVHMVRPELIIQLDDVVCAAFLYSLHHTPERVLAAWEETEKLHDEAHEGVMCEPVSPAVALALRMALTSEDAFAKVVMLSPAGVVESALSLTHGDAQLALDWLADMLARVLVAALRPDGPRWRDETAMAHNAMAILTHWLKRVHTGEENPAPATTGRLPQNSMVAGATVAVFIAAAAQFFVDARQHKAGGNLQRTVHDAWLAYKHVVNLAWLPLPLEQRILSTIANDTQEGYVILRDYARTLRVPRLNAALFADWLGLVLSWLGVHMPAKPPRKAS